MVDQVKGLGNLQHSKTQRLHILVGILKDGGEKHNEDKVKAIQNYLEPASMCKPWEFLRIVNFSRRFIPNCAANLHPPTDRLT